jgi:enamine deaminase RidA (YjgF/YER057c/UK114 family)
VDANLLSKLPPDLKGLLNSTQGAEAARTCALGHLAILSECCGGFANIRRFVKVHCYVNVNPTPAVCAAASGLASSGSADTNVQWFRESPTVANGYTDLMKQVLGEVGAHARSAICISGLPFGAAVEIEAIVELIDASLVTPISVESP